jgi:hypothetical protein
MSTLPTDLVSVACRLTATKTPRHACRSSVTASIAAPITETEMQRRIHFGLGVTVSNGDVDTRPLLVPWESGSGRAASHRRKVGGGFFTAVKRAGA